MIGVTILNGPPLYIWDGSAGQDRLFEKFSANRERERESASMDYPFCNEWGAG